MLFTSLMKGIPASEPVVYLLHDSGRPGTPAVLEKGEMGRYDLRHCLCSECTPCWLQEAVEGQWPFSVSTDWFGIRDINPETIQNEELAAETARTLEIESASSSIKYYRKKLAEFDARREESVAFAKAYRRERVEKLRAELAKAEAELEAVDNEYEARRQEIVDNLTRNEAELTKLTSGS